MGKTLVIYDNEGFLITTIYGSYRVPVGVPFIEAEIPNGKRVVGVDVLLTPHQAILEDTPKSEVELLQEQVNALNVAMAEMIGV